MGVICLPQNKRNKPKNSGLAHEMEYVSRGCRKEGEGHILNHK